MIPKSVKDAYDKEVQGGWKYLDRQSKKRLYDAWQFHTQCPVCHGNGFTKMTAHLPTPEQLSRLAADPVLAQMEVPICKDECKQCAGLGLIYTGGKENA